MNDDEPGESKPLRERNGFAKRARGGRHIEPILSSDLTSDTAVETLEDIGRFSSDLFETLVGVRESDRVGDSAGATAMLERGVLNTSRSGPITGVR
jgi:hypothetical protein